MVPNEESVLISYETDHKFDEIIELINTATQTCNNLKDKELQVALVVKSWRKLCVCDIMVPKTFVRIPKSTLQSHPITIIP